MVNRIVATVVQVLTSTGATYVANKIETDARAKAEEKKEKLFMEGITKVVSMKKATQQIPAEERVIPAEKDATVGKFLRETAPRLYQSIAEKA